MEQPRLRVRVTVSEEFTLGSGLLLVLVLLLQEIDSGTLAHTEAVGKNDSFCPEGQLQRKTGGVFAHNGQHFDPDGLLFCEFTFGRRNLQAKLTERR